MRAASDRISMAAIIVLGVAPLAFLPGALYRFALPKLAVLAAGTLLAALMSARGRLPRSAVIAGGAGCVVLAVAALAGDAPLAQLLGRWPRYEGALGLVVYAGAVWSGARVLGPRSRPRDFAVATRVAAVVAVILAIVSVAEMAGLRPLGGDVARPGALLGNATDQGIVGACLAALLAGPVLAREELRRRGIEAAGLVAALVAVVASGSRAALLGGLVGLGVVGLLQRRGRRRRTFASAGVVAVVLAALALAVPGTRSRVLEQSPLAAATVGSRFEQWAATLRIVGDHPWLGVGPSGFVDAFPAYRPSSWATTQDPSGVLDSPHNWVLQTLAAGGVLLAVCAVVLMVVLTRTAWASIRVVEDGARRDYLVGASAAVLVFAVAGLTHFTSPGIVAVLAVPLGALVSTGPQAVHLPRPVTVVARCGAGLLVVVLAFACAAEIPLARGAVAAAQGDVDRAEGFFTTAEHLRPWDGDVPLIAAQAFVPGTSAGDGPSAQAAARWSARALGRVPGSGEAGSIHVLALLGTGEPAQAAREAGALVAASPTDPYLRLLHGLALARSGEPGRAVEELQVARENPYIADLANQALDVLSQSGER